MTEINAILILIIHVDHGISPQAQRFCRYCIAWQHVKWKLRTFILRTFIDFRSKSLQAGKRAHNGDLDWLNPTETCSSSRFWRKLLGHSVTALLCPPHCTTGMISAALLITLHDQMMLQLQQQLFAKRHPKSVKFGNIVKTKVTLRSANLFPRRQRLFCAGD